MSPKKKARTTKARPAGAASPPSDDEFMAGLGPAYPLLCRLLADLCAGHPRLTWVWQKSPRVGWYRICLLEERRLFYFLPQPGAFRLNLILGGRALAALATGPHAVTVRRLRQGAQRYPEGTAFSFTDASIDVPVVLAMLEAKIAH